MTQADRYQNTRVASISMLIKKSFHCLYGSGASTKAYSCANVWWHYIQHCRPMAMEGGHHVYILSPLPVCGYSVTCFFQTNVLQVMFV